MKKSIQKSFKSLLDDKVTFSLCVAILILAIVTAITLVLRLGPTELQIATRFSAFGETQYYRNQWYYLISFVVFSLVVAVAHVSLVVKLIQRDMGSYAKFFAAITVLILLVGLLVSHAVFGVAYLS